MQVTPTPRGSMSRPSVPAPLPPVALEPKTFDQPQSPATFNNRPKPPPPSSSDYGAPRALPRKKRLSLQSGVDVPGSPSSSPLSRIKAELGPSRVAPPPPRIPSNGFASSSSSSSGNAFPTDQNPTSKSSSAFAEVAATSSSSLPTGVSSRRPVGCTPRGPPPTPPSKPPNESRSAARSETTRPVMMRSGVGADANRIACPGRSSQDPESVTLGGHLSASLKNLQQIGSSSPPTGVRSGSRDDGKNVSETSSSTGNARQHILPPKPLRRDQIYTFRLSTATEPVGIALGLGLHESTLWGTEVRSGGGQSYRRKADGVYVRIQSLVESREAFGLRTGDEVLEINGHKLDGISIERARYNCIFLL